MPLFDPNSPASEEAARFFRLKEVVASLTEFAELSGFSGDQIAAHVFIGTMKNPFNGESFEKEEMIELFCWCQIAPPEDDSFEVSESDRTSVPNKSGVTELRFRRHVRDNEYFEDDGGQDAYLFFMDRTSRIAERIIESLDGTCNDKRIRRIDGPYYNPREWWESQGRFLFADFAIELSSESSQ